MPEPPRIPSTARHYANAVFELAAEEKDYSKWAERLTGLRSLLQDTDLGAASSNPALTVAQREELCRAVLEHRPEIDERAGNLLLLLVSNRRQRLLPAIADAYQELVDRQEGRVLAQLTTAVEFSEAELGRLGKELSAKLGKDVRFESAVDPSLLGGAVIRVGDRVFDYSVKNRLQQLRQAMLSDAQAG